MKKWSIPSIVIGLSVAGWVIASEVKSRDSEFLRLDVNGDGYVSAEESLANAALAQRFAKTDRDHDSKVDANEFHDFVQRTRAVVANN
jgi:hypothetical protein